MLVGPAAIRCGSVSRARNWVERAGSGSTPRPASARGPEAPAGQELEALVGAYLSPEHCAHRADGCPIAALATEVARHPKPARATIDRAVRALAEFGRFMPGKTAADRERTAVVVFAGMAGVLNLARATSDDALRRTILEGARKFYVDVLRREP